MLSELRVFPQSRNTDIIARPSAAISRLLVRKITASQVGSLIEQRRTRPLVSKHYSLEQILADRCAMRDDEGDRNLPSCNWLQVPTAVTIAQRTAGNCTRNCHFHPSQVGSQCPIPVGEQSLHRNQYAALSRNGVVPPMMLQEIHLQPYLMAGATSLEAGRSPTNASARPPIFFGRDIFSEFPHIRASARAE